MPDLRRTRSTRKNAKIIICVDRCSPRPPRPFYERRICFPDSLSLVLYSLGLAFPDMHRKKSAYGKGRPPDRNNGLIKKTVPLPPAA